MLKRCMKVIIFVLATVMFTSTIARALNPEKVEKPTISSKTAHFVEQTIELEDLEEPETLMAASPIEVQTEKTILFRASFSEQDIEALCKTLYGEANCVKSEAERSMVVWTILNRYDAGFGDTIYEICTAPSQFSGYDPDNPVTERNMALVMDVISRWEREKNGETDVGRTLPRECYYFIADSNPSAGEWHNAFYSMTQGNRGDKIWYDYRNPIANPYQN